MFHINIQLRSSQIRIMAFTAILILTIGGIGIVSGIQLSPSNALAHPLVMSIDEVHAPYPSHCLDQRQWISPQEYTPYNIFDGNSSQVWQLCDYAIKDQGYTVTFKLTQHIEIDGFALTQVIKNGASESPSHQTKRRTKARSSRQNHEIGKQLKRFKRIQILFFNSEISKRYPVYFQEVKFDGSPRVALEYREIMAWNPILIGDPQFDERRRALGLSPSGMAPPIKIDKVGFVFWEYEGEGTPPALSELTLLLKGKSYQPEQIEAQKITYGQKIGKTYDLFTRDYLFIGDERALIFSRSGTIWGMEGEEEVAKVMGAWRFAHHRIEVDLSPRQRARTSARRRKRLDKQRQKSYRPLHLIVDDAPARVYILDSPLAGEYETTRAPVPTEVLDAKQNETPPPFEAP